MKKRAHALAPDRSGSALLIIDLISDFRFPDGAKVLRSARKIAPRITALRERAHAAGIATIYVNDAPGRWRSDLPALLAQCTRGNAAGADVVREIAPRDEDYFIMKPRHSAFYATPLEVLLDHLQTQRLIVTGLSSHQCVLFTANDAHVRNFQLAVPADCIGASSAGETRFALKYFASVLSADVRPSNLLRL